MSAESIDPSARGLLEQASRAECSTISTNTNDTLTDQSQIYAT